MRVEELCFFDVGDLTEALEEGIVVADQYSVNRALGLQHWLENLLCLGEIDVVIYTIPVHEQTKRSAIFCFCSPIRLLDALLLEECVEGILEHLSC